MDFEKGECFKPLNNVHYAIRGRVTDQADALIQSGKSVLKLNIGNPPLFGFQVPTKMNEAISQAMHNNLVGYSHGTGIEVAKEAIVEEQRRLNRLEISMENVIVGNGVSELILLITRAMLNPEDEILLPMPDYPLWTAATALNGGQPRHYRCLPDEKWYPDFDDLRQKINKKTKAILVINPNNPTGSLYPREILLEFIKIARENRLMLLADEIYSKVIYDDQKMTSIATLCDDVPIITFNGLSKNFYATGYRVGWATLTGFRGSGFSLFRENLNKLLGMRLGSNMLGQHAVKVALEECSGVIRESCSSGGRLREQRDAVVDVVEQLEGVSLQKPQGSLYAFIQLDSNIYSIKNDEELALDLLKEEGVLLTHGTGFNMDSPYFFRIVFLPPAEQIRELGGQLQRFLEKRAR